ETIAKNNPGNIYVEWSVNEKAALEVAAGASYAGARVLVTMKQVGLNVAADPLMSLNYVGIKGGMVIVVADDPGPISSQTEQDTRHFAKFAKIMVFDPVSPAEAYEMMQDAFEYSEKYKEPVIFRPTTRVCHGYQTVELKQTPVEHKPEGFVKDSSKWVIFPRLSYLNHIKLEEKMVQLSEDFSSYRFNHIAGSGKKGIAASGISYEYVKEVIGEREDIKLMKLATVHPFPDRLALEFLEGLDQVLVVEELDPVMESALVFLCGRHHLKTDIYGKLTGHVANAGENTVLAVGNSIRAFLGENDVNDTDVTDNGNAISEQPEAPVLPQRPPVLCAGCPHRASFYGVKKAMKGKKAYFSGDIGCYTLGNAKPLDMVVAILQTHIDSFDIVNIKGILNVLLEWSDDAAVEEDKLAADIADFIFNYENMPLKDCYVLSKSDLFTLNILPELVKAGISALKIEGRMKTPEYVGIITKLYRKYLDLYYSGAESYSVSKEDIYKATQIF
ncbi:MAG: hypothetical protein HGA25_11135, partial [Clostridiales bacterium]|nr:hypothetical protein [Clostridiales bacterium]